MTVGGVAVETNLSESPFVKLSAAILVSVYVFGYTLDTLYAPVASVVPVSVSAPATATGLNEVNVFAAPPHVGIVTPLASATVPAIAPSLTDFPDAFSVGCITHLPELPAS